MTPERVVWFFNHKYGEQAYMMTDTDTDRILIMTPKGKWAIFLKDYKRFGHYDLYHMSKDGSYHKQCYEFDLSYCVFRALAHDCLMDGKSCMAHKAWIPFQKSYEIWLYGRWLEREVSKWYWDNDEDVPWAFQKEEE